MFYNNFQQPSSQDTLKMLHFVTEVVRFEAVTELTFDYLKVIAPTKEDGMFLQMMLDDEREHFEELKNIYFSITGKQPAGDPPTFEVPETYVKGVHDLFLQKLEIIAVLKKIKKVSPYPAIKEKAFDFIQDELRHLPMLNHILLKTYVEERVYDYRPMPFYFPTTFS